MNKFFLLTSGKKVQIRKPALSQPDIAPLRRSSRPVIISSSAQKKSTPQHRPLRERLIHLLALKPYKKPELILRLQKDGLLPLDKDSLDSHLQQVLTCYLNPLSCISYTKALLSTEANRLTYAPHFCFLGGLPEW